MSFDLARYQDPLAIQRVLLDAKTIAIVGLSGNPLRASNFVGFYVQRHGYHIIPVNPREPEILGERSYASLRYSGSGGHRRCVPRSGSAARYRQGCGGDWRQVPVVSVLGHQRGRRPHCGGRWPDGDHGSLSEGRACPIRRAHALARVQYSAGHLRSRWAAIARAPG